MPNKDNNILKYDNGKIFESSTYYLHQPTVFTWKKLVLVMTILMNDQQAK